MIVKINRMLEGWGSDSKTNFKEFLNFDKHSILGLFVVSRLRTAEKKSLTFSYLIIEHLFLVNQEIDYTQFVVLRLRTTKRLKLGIVNQEIDYTQFVVWRLRTTKVHLLAANYFFAEYSFTVSINNFTFSLSVSG
jgi:hypothetical protein